MQKKAPDKRMVCECGGPKEVVSRRCHKCAHPERGLDVLRGIASGLTPKEIGFGLGVATKTVEYHWVRLKAVHGFESYVDAAHFALSLGLIENKYCPADCHQAAGGDSGAKVRRAGV
jgi:DNA-binding CsgD family transcriptional regulator